MNLFVQEHSGDFNLDIDVQTHRIAHRAIEFIRLTGGYWYGGTLTHHLGDLFTWDDTGDVFIPLHRIDRFEIRGTETPEQGQE